MKIDLYYLQYSIHSSSFKKKIISLLDPRILPVFNKEWVNFKLARILSRIHYQFITSSMGRIFLYI